MIGGNVITDGSVKDDGFYQMGKARSYDRSSVGVVKDNATGLEWQDNYSDNGGSIKYANWQGALDYCSVLGLDGGGWRLPSIEELETSLDYGKYNPSVTENIFEHISSLDYWSSTAYANDTSHAWSVNFQSGYFSTLDKLYGTYVRCVRGGQLETSNFSRDNATEVVTDSTTGLQWQDNEAAKTTMKEWQDAIDYCENDVTLGGHNDWRLPNSKELLSIADWSRYDPVVDTTYFFNVSSYSYFVMVQLPRVSLHRY